MRTLLFSLFLLGLISCSNSNSKPSDFVYLDQEIPSVIIEARYFDSNNFVGQPVNGYNKGTAICTQAAANALKQVAMELVPLNMRIKVFDAYRPQKAVDHFKTWALDLNDTLTKPSYYPEIPKSRLFELNYIAKKSSHSRGSTFDLTLVDGAGMELDMGTSWDYFGTASWPTDTTVSEEAQKNRAFLAELMTKHGFTPYAEEWWHFTLAEEPYPNTYFDFDVE
jgi:D-alanyl-D-alanine dipeptidase